MVSRIVTGPDGKATGVEYFDKSGASHFVKARAVVLAASACESARLLLNSKDGGLANASGQVGRNLMKHNNGAILAATNQTTLRRWAR